MKTNQTIIENGSLKDVSYEFPKCVVINVESDAERLPTRGSL